MDTCAAILAAVNGESRCGGHKTQRRRHAFVAMIVVMLKTRACGLVQCGWPVAFLNCLFNFTLVNFKLAMYKAVGWRSGYKTLKSTPVTGVAQSVKQRIRNDEGQRFDSLIAPATSRNTPHGAAYSPFVSININKLRLHAVSRRPEKNQ